MFKLSQDDINRLSSNKPIQSTEEIFEALGFDDLMEPSVKVEMQTAFHDIFGRYARIVNPKDGGEKVYAVDAHRLLEYLCRVWAELYGTVAISCEEVLRDKALLEEEIYKLSKSEVGRVQKLSGKPDVCKEKTRAIQVLTWSAARPSQNQSREQRPS